jgi:ParB family chromosome partitioning protein
LVRRVGERFQIVAGERRFRASQAAGLDFIPAIVKSLTDKATLQISLVENIQRQQLNPIEEARAYQKLMDDFALSQERVAELVGKKRASVANVLRILSLDPEVQRLVESGELSLGHAKAIAGVKDHAAQRSLARKVQIDGLSVRALEKLIPQVMVLDRGKAVKSSLDLHATGNEGIGLDDSTYRAGQGDLDDVIREEKGGKEFPEVLDRLRTFLGTRIVLQHAVSGRGRIVIDYHSEQDLDRIVELICEGFKDVY